MRGQAGAGEQVAGKRFELGTCQGDGKHLTAMAASPFPIAKRDHTVDNNMPHPKSQLIGFKGCGLIFEALRVKNGKIRPSSSANNAAIRKANAARR